MRLHQHQRTVVSPRIELAVTFPLRVAQAFLFGKDMQVCHTEIESTVRATGDVGIANSALFGNTVTANHRLSVVHGGKGIAVTADSHEDAMGRVTEKHKKIGSHIFFARGLGLPLCR